MKKGLLLLFFSFFAEAASGEGIPLREIFFQALNFFLFFAFLLFLLRKPVQNFYKNRQKDFLLFEEQAKKKEQEIEAHLKSWETKIKELEVKTQTIKEDAKREGERFLLEKEKEIKDLKKQLEMEKDFFIHLESEKIKRESFKKWKKKVVKRAEVLLEKEYPKNQQKMYQDLFKQLEGRS